VSPLSIRPGRPADATSVLELWRRAGSVPTRTDDEESIRFLIEHDPNALLVAEDGGDLVGTLIAAFDGWRGMLYRLAVLPERRRSGVGRALVAAGERSLRARGAVRVSCVAIKAETVALAFWTAAGYVGDHRIRRFVKNLAP